MFIWCWKDSVVHIRRSQRKGEGSGGKW